jgi:hypothetical protein
MRTAPGIVAAVFLVIGLVACDTNPDRTSSPTSRFVAVRSHASATVVTFAVEDGYGHSLYAPPFRFTEPVTVVWDADERLWIRSTSGVVVWAPRDVGADWAPLSAAAQAALTPPAGI